jgi:hypothetical protein
MGVDRSRIRLWRLGSTCNSRSSSTGGKNGQVSSMSYMAKVAEAVLAETPRRDVSAPNEAGISVPITEQDSCINSAAGDRHELHQIRAYSWHLLRPRRI